MVDDVFYTTYVVPGDTTQADLKNLFKFLASSRSVGSYYFNAAESTISIVVAARYSSLKYSDCPLPGTHDFAAGWLACEAMLTISKHLNASLAWQEGEFHQENGRIDIRRRGKPPVIINWHEFVKARPHAE